MELAPDAAWTLETQEDDTLFVYILQGAGKFGAENADLIPEKHALLFTQGNIFKAQTTQNGIRFLLLSAKALHEPISWGGPIVMNTQQELELAFQELEKNTFIKG